MRRGLKRGVYKRATIVANLLLSAQLTRDLLAIVKFFVQSLFADQSLSRNIKQQTQLNYIVEQTGNYYKVVLQFTRFLAIGCRAKLALLVFVFFYSDYVV